MFRRTTEQEMEYDIFILQNSFSPHGYESIETLSNIAISIDEIKIL